uniref:GST N-terminal domain-containing protein n=1 Tax=Chromera velia CCMP2878 TaxID=1169474 RepID=A0A0G4I0W8_9ALVE|eukprot:Cvel_10047.t1-p1 / transcript=Cvel_10047.t1 / gene=Cvel_10047 / organism=Chromera_velia_CCMP2878 / gene_product=hypothetical protein / transcript_product=hypothetical protein / location=Cvel_scaffold597:70708-73978(+) / protein_length=335 / sequence_SO=supercontig / SO=protein_coding / is_pseudo=false
MNFFAWTAGASSTTLGVLQNVLPRFLWEWLDFFALMTVVLTRVTIGGLAFKGHENCNRPAKLLILYEFEACPFCKKVREALGVLNLDYMCYPCPRETFKKRGVVKESRYRGEALAKGRKAQFPLLIDENTGTTMYESDAIIDYLFTKYGNTAQKSLIWNLLYSQIPQLNAVLLFLVSLLRTLPEHGLLRIPSRRPEKPLELYGTENSPFVKRVRETLCSLELPYIFHTLPLNAKVKREALKAAYGHEIGWSRQKAGLFKIPFLKDPNTNTHMFESLRIVEYLKRTYQTGDPVKESFWDYGKDDESPPRPSPSETVGDPAAPASGGRQRVAATKSE